MKRFLEFLTPFVCFAIIWRNQADISCLCGPHFYDENETLDAWKESAENVLQKVRKKHLAVVVWWFWRSKKLQQLKQTVPHFILHDQQSASQLINGKVGS